ncbi:UNVERIFIED_CONTAM: hypothetical protein NY100_30890, partial [Prevotella sp. 15_C9]
IDSPQFHNSIPYFPTKKSAQGLILENQGLPRQLIDFLKMDENSALKTQNLILLLNSERIKIITLGNSVSWGR